MSYSIYIGEGFVSKCSDTGALSVEVRGMSHPDAPSFPGDDMTGNSNARHPGYSQWDTFCRETGLHELFFHRERGLMSSHPGCFALTQTHLDAVKHALAAWKASHPDAIPGWDPKADKFTGEGGDPRYDGNLARLEWLAWWMRWTLDNCKVPAIYNR